MHQSNMFMYIHVLERYTCTPYYCYIVNLECTGVYNCFPNSVLVIDCGYSTRRLERAPTIYVLRVKIRSVANYER